MVYVIAPENRTVLVQPGEQWRVVFNFGASAPFRTRGEALVLLRQWLARGLSCRLERL